MQLDLSSEEALELRGILENYLGDLRMEVSQTDNMDFRERLKAREAVVKELIARLRGGGESHA